VSAFFGSNIVIDMLAGHPPALKEAAMHGEAAISRITWMEVLVGAPDTVTQASWESFLTQFEIVELDEDVPGGYPTSAKAPHQAAGCSDLGLCPRLWNRTRDAQH
jgi:hypothetical protein